MTLAAALRDGAHPTATVRIAGLRNAAPALLAELDQPGPRWRGDQGHPQGDAVVALLRAGLTDPVPEARGYAMVGLGLLGRPELLPVAAAWLWGTANDTPRGEVAEHSDDGDPRLTADARLTAEDRQWLGETAVIALSFLGHCAPVDDSVRPRVSALLRQAFASDQAYLRFQAALALIEVDGAAAEGLVAAALAQETEPTVRTQLVVALSHLPQLSDTTCQVLAAALEEVAQDDPADPTALGLEAALALTAAGRAEGGPRLVQALSRPGDRDRALEALALLGTRAPAEAIPAIRGLMGRFGTPGVTRVRCAYALKRLLGSTPTAPAPGPSQPPTALHADPGERWLRALAWHPRAAVRQAVRDARRALASLDGATNPVP